MKSQLKVAATIALAAFIGLAGCEGDDGKDGAPGESITGPPGEDGIACWDLNENRQADPEEDINNDGVVDTFDCQASSAVTPLESCAVCHSEGSINSAPAAHEVTGVPTVSDVIFADDGVGNLVVSYNLLIDGMAVTDFTIMESNYIFNDGITLPAGAEDPVSLGGGDYTVTIPGGVAAADPASRFFLRVSDGTTKAVVSGDYPAPALTNLVSDQSCQNCHGPTGIAPHTAFGYPGMDSSECVVCHKAEGGLPFLSFEDSYVGLIHGIHNSHDFPEGFYAYGEEEFEITYPSYMPNCSVCHDSEPVLAAANAMPVAGDATCFTCHGGMDGFDFTGLEFHLSIPDPGTADCQQCHVDGGIARATVAEFHNGIVTERGGIIFDGVDTSVTEGARFGWTIDSVVDDGTDLAISWSATYDGVGIDPCNATVGAGAPVFFADGNGNLSMLRNYFQGDDPILGQSTSAPGQALSVNVTVDNTTCTGNVATTTIPVDDVDVERGIVALQGKPRVVSVLDPTATMAVRVPTPTYEWLIGSGDAPLMARRPVVDTVECLQCHVGSLYQHGGNRVDNVDMCVLCHNSASNEQSVRVGLGVDPSEAYDGKVGETFEMKTMLHRIHSAGTEGSPLYVIYRGRGIYAWAPDESFLPATWPGLGPQVVFGSEGDRVINHNFHAPTYPRALNDCAACHTPDFAVLPDQTKAMATTTDAGSTEWINQLDDTLQGATTTACITCHTDAATKGHAYQNSWTPQVFPEGRQTIIDAAD